MIPWIYIKAAMVALGGGTLITYLVWLGIGGWNA
jgi:hypothetical protein